MKISKILLASAGKTSKPEQDPPKGASLQPEAVPATPPHAVANLSAGKAVHTAVAKVREGVRAKAKEVVADAEQALVNALHTLQADAKSAEKHDVERVAGVERQAVDVAKQEAVRAKTDVKKGVPAKGASK